MSILKERKDLLECFLESVISDENTQNQGGQSSVAQATASAQAQTASLLDRDVSDFLYNDLETKLLEILQEAKKIMRHSKRSVLSTQDVNAAFKKLNIQETYGYPSSVPFNYEKLSAENQNLWLVRSSNIDLKNFVI
jgi:transcription initiation factor TFIID subunit 6